MSAYGSCQSVPTTTYTWSTVHPPGCCSALRKTPASLGEVVAVVRPRLVRPGDRAHCTPYSRLQCFSHESASDAHCRTQKVLPTDYVLCHIGRDLQHAQQTQFPLGDERAQVLTGKSRVPPKSLVCLLTLCEEPAGASSRPRCHSASASCWQVPACGDPPCRRSSAC